MIGKQIRLGRILSDADRVLLIALEQGLTIGPIKMLRDLSEAYRAIQSPSLNGIVLQQGPARHFAQEVFGDAPTALIVNLFSSTFMSGKLEDIQQVCSVEHAISLGADAVLLQVPMSTRFEPMILHEFGQVSGQCLQWGMPLITRMITEGIHPDKRFSGIFIKHAARLAYEIGADIVAIDFPALSDHFAGITKSVAIPVLVSGGPNVATPESCLDTVRSAMDRGAAGVLLNMTLLDEDNPALMIQQLGKIIHDNKTTF